MPYWGGQCPPLCGRMEIIMKNLLKCGLLLILCVLQICIFGSCGNNDGEIPQDSRVISVAPNIAQHGNYIYYVIGGAVFRYNLITGDFGSACMEPTCAHDYASGCVMFDIRSICFITNDRLYFSYYSKDIDGDFNYAAYNLLDGTLSIIKQCETYEVFTSHMKTDGTYLYYSYKRLKDGGNADDPNDYVPAVFRQPLSGGKEEFLCYADSNTAFITFIYNDKLIFEDSANGVFYSTDLDGQNKKIIFNNDGYDFFQQEFLLDGNIYFLASDGTYDISATGTNVYHYNLFKVNVITGEYKKLLEDYVNTYTMINDKIYYLLYELRTVYTPPNYGQPDCKEVPTVWLYDDTLRCCDLEGGSIEQLYTKQDIKYLSLSQSCYVVGDKMYGQFRTYDAVSNEQSAPCFGVMDIKKGSYTMIADMSDYLTILGYSD